jgi:hypothetical protein
MFVCECVCLLTTVIFFKRQTLLTKVIFFLLKKKITFVKRHGKKSLSSFCWVFFDSFCWVFLKTQKTSTKLNKAMEKNITLHSFCWVFMMSFIALWQQRFLVPFFHYAAIWFFLFFIYFILLRFLVPFFHYAAIWFFSGHVHSPQRLQHVCWGVQALSWYQKK